MVRAFGAALLAAMWIAPASSTDLNRCAAIADDGPRLACYDKLAVRSAPPRSSAAADRAKIRDSIIERCQRQMGTYGPAMVKGCVDMDLEAHTALAGYPAKNKAIVDRCARQMRSYGWAMVQGCADMDIEAAEALERMQNR